MASPTEIAAQTYAAAWSEPDPAIRARMIDACFAVDGRIVSPGAVIRGRAALAAAITDFRADPRGLTAALASPVDARGPIFRFRSTIAHRDGTTGEFFDTGEVDADGRITVLIAFAGPLPEAPRAP